MMMQNRTVTPRNVLSNIFQSHGGFSKTKPATFNAVKRELNALPYYRKFNAMAKEKNGSSGPSRILIYNLHARVTDAEIKEFFQEFGRIKSSTVLFDYKGRSLGRAEVIFKRRYDAIKAIESYNGRCLDDLPMDIKIDKEYSAVQNTVARRITTAPRSTQQILGQAERKIDDAPRNDQQRLGHIRRTNDTSQSLRQTNGRRLDDLRMDSKIDKEYSAVQNTVARRITTAPRSTQQSLGQAERKIDDAPRNDQQRLCHIRRTNDTSQSLRQTNGRRLDDLPMDSKIDKEYSAVQHTVARRITTAPRSTQQSLGQAKRKIDDDHRNDQQD